MWRMEKHDEAHMLSEVSAERRVSKEGVGGGLERLGEGLARLSARTASAAALQHRQSPAQAAPTFILATT